MDVITIAAAQTEPVKGDVAANLRDHITFARLAASEGADVVFFPELSLTGYEPELAAELALMPDDDVLQPLKRLSSELGITIVGGMPIRNPRGKPYLGLACFEGNNATTYFKRHLHTGEENWFSPGSECKLLSVKSSRIGLAICADIAHASHPADAADAGAVIYAPCVFLTPRGHAADSALLRECAIRHHMAVIMANYCGASGGMAAAGRSAVWDEAGRLIIEAATDRPGLIIADHEKGLWTGRVVAP